MFTRGTSWKNATTTALHKQRLLEMLEDAGRVQLTTGHRPTTQWVWNGPRPLEQSNVRLGDLKSCNLLSVVLEAGKTMTEVLAVRLRVRIHVLVCFDPSCCKLSKRQQGISPCPFKDTGLISEGSVPWRHCGSKLLSLGISHWVNHGLSLWIGVGGEAFRS